ncbi:cytochrome c oxidase accessory protein CcoG [Portibacter marinus]|uniref:cytochrome c oxidase accessory protein CcoG n=1 Tax=Portibacter marinus TaxID=2898660 RepID=UPI001F39CE84|nr:cytochrome c oxidase accessory protein CcoG [Portibacter marinus]
MTTHDEENEEFRDSLATVDSKGKRVWVYPKKPNGRYYNYRKILSYFLLALLFVLPWLEWKGQPLFLLNILERKFILFGFYFPPQDFFLFVIGMLIFIVFIALFTVIYGRLFCGWICPQTIFMEMVFRRIEYFIEGDATAQIRLNKSSWTIEKWLKKGIKHLIFFMISVAIANTFLAYIIGKKAVLQLITEPILLHINGFIAMIIFSLVFYGVFAFLREQVCTTICPYGRLQGVLLDTKSLAVYYDFVRGEPRGKIRKNAPSDEVVKGDCIDCNLCVKVCPTGIDIRNGIQLECVNCTACMDACDEVMEKIDRPKGLIRIDSYQSITNDQHSKINNRSIAYSVVLVILIALEAFLLMTRSEVEVLILKTPGTLFYEAYNNRISNMYNYQLTNKTDEILNLEFRCSNMNQVEFEFIGSKPETIKQGQTEGVLLIKIPKELMDERKINLKIDVLVDEKVIDQVKTTFIGPIK